MTITGGKKLYQSFFLFFKHFQPCSVVVYKKKNQHSHKDLLSFPFLLFTDVTYSSLQGLSFTLQLSPVVVFSYWTREGKVLCVYNLKRK